MLGFSKVFQNTSFQTKKATSAKLGGQGWSHHALEADPEVTTSGQEAEVNALTFIAFYLQVLAKLLYERSVFVTLFDVGRKQLLVRSEPLNRKFVITQL